MGRKEDAKGTQCLWYWLLVITYLIISLERTDWGPQKVSLIDFGALSATIFLELHSLKTMDHLKMS